MFVSSHQSEDMWLNSVALEPRHNEIHTQTVFIDASLEDHKFTVGGDDPPVAERTATTLTAEAV